jgi:hypothetical protein
MNPLVSFVVPCYRLAHVLPECIDSILTQSYQNFEVLVMDNCSPDATPEVARSFSDARVKHVRNEVNIGHIRNYNKGISLSRGKYVWWISPDDLLYSPHVLGRYVDLMERNPGVGYAFCRCLELKGNINSGIAGWTDCGDEDRIWEGREFLARLVNFDCIVQSSGMVRRTCYEKVGLFPVDLVHAGDWYLWCLMALHYDVAYLAEPMVCWRNHPETMTASFCRDDVSICIGEEFAVLWRVSQQAELVGGPDLRSVCRAGLVGRGLSALRTVPSGQRPGITLAEFETVLRARITDLKEVDLVRAQVYSHIAGEQYWRGEYSDAKQSYLRVLSIRPGWLSAWIKYLLLRMGGVGFLLRRLLRQLRRPAGYVQ